MTPSVLELPDELRERIVAHALSEAPKEACGIIGGSGSLAREVFEMANADPGNTTYMMDPQEQFQVIKQLRTGSLDMLAIYHSHPETEAYPSPTDRRLAFYPDCFYVIISLADKEQPVLRAFHISDGEVVEDEVLSTDRGDAS